MSDSLADIAVPLPLYNTFTYLVPPELQALAKPGCRVLIPFGRKHLSGVIVSSPERSTLVGVVEMLELCGWISEYYIAPLGEVLKAALPQGLSLEGKRIVRLKVHEPLSSSTSSLDLSKKQLSIFDALKVKDGQTIPHLQTKTRARNIHATLNEMVRQGLVDIEDRIPQPKVKVKRERVVQLSAQGLDLLAMKKPVDKLTAKQTFILNAIGKSRRPVREILQAVGATSASLKALGLKGLLLFEEVELKRESLYENLEPPPQIVLNMHQQAAIHTRGRITIACGPRPQRPQ
ncbi:MAG: primosomal protein N', partial [Bacteroidetes bacterium]|nr:primosomal protein N' [Bacteroidota bacterium]